jgi:SPP1 gp7 family putative phage head morphogenesis protein
MVRSSGYWRRRFEILEEAKSRMAGRANADAEREFKKAQQILDDQINAWYGRFAVNNQITLADAKAWLSGKDLDEFRWSVDEYIRRGKEAAIDPSLAKRLENASARFHVSKLEALKLQTQATVESLYGKAQTSAASLFGHIYKDNYCRTAYELQRGFEIGWNMAAPGRSQIEGVLSKPWTLDKLTFSDRLWTQKQSLIDAVHTHLIRGLVLGKPPDGAIKEISKKFGASRMSAGRLIMTESAYFASLAQRDAFNALDVEEYEVVEALDGETCEICGSMDGERFSLRDYEAGKTAPPFHPWCRGCTAPYFADDGGARFARGDGDGGQRYYVPSDMKFGEWREMFVEGGDKGDLIPVEGESGLIEYRRSMPAAELDPNLNEGAESAIITMGTLEQSLGAPHAGKMQRILQDSPDDVKGVWNRYADRLQVVNAHSPRAFCDSKGISVDINRVSREEMTLRGEVAKKPYYTVFHEFGHNIDRIAQNERGYYVSLADAFNSRAHTYSNGVGYTLTEMLEAEGKQRVDEAWKKLKKEAIAAGGKASDVGKFKAYQAIVDEMLSKPVVATSDVSDMWDGITKGVVRPHYGHGKSYWKYHSVGVEGFAEMFSATVMNPESVEEIKHYFPKSYEIFEEIISELVAVK